MNWYKSLQIFRIKLYLALVLFCLLPLPLHSYPELLAKITFPPTTRRPNVPTRTAGAGGRWIKPPSAIQPPPAALPAPSSVPDQTASPQPSCTYEGKTPLTVLTPSNNIGTTLAANPTFFWYVPQTNAKTAEFVIVDDNRKDVYRTIFTLSKTAGVVQLNLPKTVNLATDKSYLWQFEIICDPQNRDVPDKQYVQGLVRRIAINSQQNSKLENAVSPLVKAQLYADAGIWHEAITTLAGVRSYQPIAWEEMLKSVGLEAIAPVPFVNCCTIRDY